MIVYSAESVKTRQDMLELEDLPAYPMPLKHLENSFSHMPHAPPEAAITNGSSDRDRLLLEAPANSRS